MGARQVDVGDDVEQPEALLFRLDKKKQEACQEVQTLAVPDAGVGRCRKTPGC